MPKKKPQRSAKSVERRGRASRSKADDADAITEDKLLGYFTAAYVLDAVGLLDPEKRARLDTLVFPGCPTWSESVESAYGISRRFVRSVYALCTEINTPPAAVLFILRGIGCPDHQTRLRELLGLPSDG